MKLQRYIIGLVIGLGVIGGYFFGAELAREKYEENAVPTEVIATKPEIEVEAVNIPSGSESNANFDGEIIEEEFEIYGTSTDLDIEGNDGEEPGLFEEDLQSI